MMYALGDLTPQIDPGAWIAPGAVIIGKVRVAKGASVWFGAVLRGDNEWIDIGENSNVQENCTLHTDMGFPLHVGAHCTIGHNVLLHGCSIGDCALVGMKSTIMNGALVGSNCLVGAGSLITEKKDFSAPNQMIMGAPAKVVRQLSDTARQSLRDSADHYAANAQRFAKTLHVLDSSLTSS